MKKKFLTILTILLILAVALAVVACVDYTDPTEEEEETDTITRTQLITNGTFYNAKASTTGDYIKETVNGWTATKGSLALNANGVRMGVIDLSDTAGYENNKDKFGVDEGTVFENPGVDDKTPFDTDDSGNITSQLQDNNALVIASKETAGSIYYKNSSSYTLEANKYYLLQYSVCTNIDLTGVADADKDKKGAWVHIAGDVDYTDSCINTNGKWETRYLYIESNKLNTAKLDIRLWLGNGPSKISSTDNVYSTRGAVMFDNIICTEVTQAKDDAYNGGNVVTLDHETFGTLAKNAVSENSSIGYESIYYITDAQLKQSTETTPTTTNAINYYYSFREGVYTSTNVKNYDLVKGKTGLSSSDYPTVTNAYTGIVDLSKLYAGDAASGDKDTYSTLLPSSYKYIAPSFDDWKNKIMAGDARGNISSLGETKALMLYHNDLSGAGLKSKNVFTVEENGYYIISVWVYVWAPVDENGAFVWPTANAPTKPAELSETQGLLRDYFENNTGNGEIFYGYFESLSDAENAITEGNAPGSVTAVDSINEYVASDAFMALLRAVYDSEVADNFKFKYVYDNFDTLVTDGSLAEGDKDYIEYRYLSERSNFLKNTWAPVKALVDKWNDYDEDFDEYMAKYTIWQNNNSSPYAKVKLTGAGDDIEQTTKTYNTGWEQLTFYVQGNQLSGRNLNLEFWYGEGSSTEYDNLMFGGAFFDNVDIISISEDTKDSVYPDKDWRILSPLTSVGELDFGGLTDNVTSIDDHWKYELAEGTATADASKVSISSQMHEKIGSVKLEGGEEVELKELILKHSSPTASILECTDTIKIKPNTAYRLAMWVKTKDIAEGKGVTIDLMGGEDKDSLASVSNVATFNNEEWTEVVFYILGDVIKMNEVSLKFTVGSGTRFSTDSYIGGELYIAVLNCTEIKYSEYNSSSKSGDQVSSYSFTNTGSASESVTNGSFSSLDYANTDDEEFDKDSGSLIGVGTTSNWTQGTVKNNTFNTISLSNTTVGDSKYKLEWEPVVGVDKEGNDTQPTHYEIYARFTEDNKSVERLYKTIEADQNKATLFGNGKFFVEVDMANKTSTSFRVRAVSNNAVSAFSNYSTPGTSSAEGNVFVPIADEETGKKEYKAGTVSNEGLFEDSSYKSPFNTALKISSNYNVALKMTAASKSLNANSYYLVSVWVKTLDSAKAAVTVSNVSNVLTANVEQNYIGYVDIDTEGKWTQYCFYIKTGSASTSVNLELSLGNPYAIKTTKKSEKVTTSVATYKDTDLSKGTVYFDGVRVLTVTEDEYNAELEKGEYNEDGTVKMHDFKYLYTGNQYAFRNLEYTTDSFDSFTENTTTEGNDGYNNGHTPNNYDWSKSSDSTGTTEKERMYGVYNYQSDSNEKLRELTTVTDDEENTVTNVFEDFMPDGFDIKDFIRMDGYNSLVMSNKVVFGQTYTTGSSATINSTSYYKLSFKAKTLIAREVEDSEGNKSYVTDGVNAEFRFMQNSAVDKYQSILLNTHYQPGDDAVEYTLYIYNPSATSSSAKWSFHLGADNDDEDTTGTKQFLIGMMVLDQVSLTTISEDDYNAAKTSVGYDNMTEEQKINSALRFYSYDEDEKTDDGDDDGDDDETPPKTSIWDRGEAWLLISSLVIAVVIIIVVLVVIIKRWKKKHPKEVIGENVTQTEKEIKVVVHTQEKVEVEEDAEYSDEIKPAYVQRVVQKKKKKKKK